MNRLLTIPVVLAAGCTVMVNGKPRRIGGPDPQAQAQAQPAPTSSAPPPASAPAPAPRRPGAPPPPPASRPPAVAGRVVAIDGTLTSTPIVTRVEGVVFDTTYGKQHGHGGNSPDCGSDMTSAPIASIELAQEMPSMNIVLVGGSNDGYVLRRGDALWFACTHSTNEVPTITGLKEGWQPGRYDIYPVSRYGRGARPTFQVEVFDPAKPAVWSDSVKKVTIAQKLSAPVFVDVVARPNRRVLRSAHAGWGCEKAAFADEPDIALELERPIPGLIVRPLPTATPVTLRREHRDATRGKVDKGCPRQDGMRSLGGAYTPSYHADSELHFGTNDEGTYGISVGTADGAPVTVTLMIYDSSTKLDPFAKHAIDDVGSLDRRWLGWHFPQLDLRELSTRDYAHLELTARLFAAAPREVVVYAKLDLDKDIASGPSDQFPKKNEPLLVLDVSKERAEVLTADGVRFRVRTSHLLLAPDGGEIAVPTTPRALHKLEIGTVSQMLPPSAKALVTAREKRIAARDKCIDRTWAPYGRQLPRITRPAGVDIVVYESARTKNIRAAGNAAVDRACGTDAAAAKITERERVKMLGEVDKARARLLAAATASLRR